MGDRKNVIKPFHLVDDGDMSGNITSASTNVLNVDNVGYIVSWSGSSPEGTLTVEVQNGDSEWVALSFGAAITVTGNTGKDVIFVQELPFEKIRFVYTRSSGTGLLQVWSTAKMV